MTTFYTGRGDDGTTGVSGKGRMDKDSYLAHAIGEIDEFNSVIGVAIANSTDAHLSRVLKAIQNKLFVIGAELAAAPEGSAPPKSKITEQDIKGIEHEIDEFNAKLPDQKKFVLPGGSSSASYLHLSRSVARRAERAIVALSKVPNMKVNPHAIAYLNRLSSFFFAAALYMNKKEGIEEYSPTY